MGIIQEPQSTLRTQSNFMKPSNNDGNEVGDGQGISAMAKKIPENIRKILMLIICISSLMVLSTLITTPSSKFFSSLEGKAQRYLVNDRPHPVRQYFMRRNSASAKQKLENQFWQPQILAAVARPYRENNSWVELFVLTSGVHSYSRGWEAKGCVISNVVYKVLDQHFDTVICLLDRHLKKHDTISLMFHTKEVEKFLGTFENVSLSRPSVANADLFTVPPQNVKLSVKIKDYIDNHLILKQSFKLGYNTEDILPKRHFLYSRKPRYALCSMIQVRGFRSLLKPWVEYHRRAGVDHILLIDNNDHTDPEELFKHRTDIEVVFWPWRKTQVQAFTYGLLHLRHICDSVAVHDMDEYIMVGLGKRSELASRRPLSMYVRRLWSKGYGYVRFIQSNFGNAAHVHIPDKPPAEVYIYLADSQYGAELKSIMRSDHEWTQNMLHYTNHRNYIATYDPRGDDVLHPVELSDLTSVIHYKYRAYEEMIHKKNNGSASPWDGFQLKEEHELEKPNYDHPPDEYNSLNASLRYTHFRKTWREVMQKGSEDLQLIVQVRGNLRCERLYNWRKKIWNMIEDCETEFGKHGDVRSSDDDDDDGRQ